MIGADQRRSFGISMISFYFPVFFIQLNAELYGVDHNLAFYLVSCPSRCSSISLLTLLALLAAYNLQRHLHRRTHHPQLYRRPGRRSKHCYCQHRVMQYHHARHARNQQELRFGRVRRHSRPVRVFHR